MEKIIGYIRYSSHAQDMEIEKFYIDTAKADDSQKIVRNTTA